MFDDIQLNVPLLRRRVPNLTVAAKAVGLRPATVSNLCNGQYPLGRAEVRTLVALASLAGCSLDELVLTGAGASMVETGIKVLDLFAPLVRGGTAGLVARPGQGQTVLLSELMRRLKQRGYATVLWLPPHPHPDLAAVMTEAEGVGNSLDAVQRHVSTLRAERDVLVAADRATVLSGDLMTLRERLQEPGARPVTFLLVDARGEAPDEEAPYGPLETLWRFDMELAARGLFPAVDPVSSTSTLLEGAQLEAAHLTLQQRARKVLRRYRELRTLVQARPRDPAAVGDSRIPPRRAAGGVPDATVLRGGTIHEDGRRMGGTAACAGSARRILDGAADETEVKDLKYVGRYGGV